MKKRYLWVLVAIALMCVMTGIVAGQPNAQFTAIPLNGYAPLTVQFTDQSTVSGTATYKWDINNDGTTDYTTKNPVHTYRRTGTYSVKLIVRDSTGRGCCCPAGARSGRIRRDSRSASASSPGRPPSPPPAAPRPRSGAPPVTSRRRAGRPCSRRAGPRARRGSRPATRGP